MGPRSARRDDRKAVGVEQAAVDGHADLAPDIRGEIVELRAIVIAVLRFELERPAGRTARHDVDDAAHGVVAVQARARSVHDLDAVHALERHAGPVHPPAERIVERDAVDEHQRAAHAARPDPAQRHALRGRMRGEAAGAPEQAEGRDLPEHIVGDDGRRHPDLLGIQHADARRNITEPLLGARGGHCDLFEQRGRRQHDLHRPRHVGHAFLFLGEAARPHDDGDVAGLGHVHGEPPVRARRHALFRAGLDPDDDRRARDDAAARIVHDTGNRRCRQGQYQCRNQCRPPPSFRRMRGL